MLYVIFYTPMTITQPEERALNLCSLPNIIRLVKSRRIGCAGYVVCLAEMINEYKNLARKPRGKM